MEERTPSSCLFSPCSDWMTASPSRGVRCLSCLDLRLSCFCPELSSRISEFSRVVSLWSSPRIPCSSLSRPGDGDWRVECMSVFQSSLAAFNFSFRSCNSTRCLSRNARAPSSDTCIHTAQYSTVQYSTAQYSIVPAQYSTVQHSTAKYSTVQYSTSTVQYSTVQYSTVQYSTIHCSIV